jgi:hypothetical protein
MAFNPNIDYVGHQRLRAQGIEGVTRAKLQTKLRKEEEERRAAAARAAKKKKSSFGSKIIGAVARGAAAYYTGGASEATGLGAMLDQQLRGGDDYERNEYGDMVGAASSMSSLMTAKTANAASERLNAQSARDDAMQERMDKISPRAGMKFAEERAAKDAKNREVFNDYKSGFLNFGKDIDGLDLDATIGDYSGITNNKKVGNTKTTPIDTSPSSSYSPINQLSTLKPSATTDSGGLSTTLTEDQADLFRGPKEPESPDPVKFNQSGTGTDEPVQSEPAKLETIDDQMAHFRD